MKPILDIRIMRRGKCCPLNDMTIRVSPSEKVTKHITSSLVNTQ